MKIQWLGLSCFQLYAGECSLVFDPYTGVRGYGEVHTAADVVLKSHDHGDHAFLEGVSLSGRTDTPFRIKKVMTWHDDAEGRKRGKNTVHAVTAEGFTVVHLGDLGHLPDGKTVEELKNADLLLIPVGGFYTIDAPTAKKVCEMLSPKAVVPMHYRHGAYGHEPIGVVEDFLKLFPEEEIHRMEDDSFTLPVGGVILPQYKKERQ